MTGWTPAKRELAVVLALAAYGAAWTVYRVVSRMPLDLHFDLTELYMWSQGVNAARLHPPLSSVIFAAWNSLFGAGPWSFAALAATNIAVTLYICWRIAVTWLPAPKAILGLACLTLVPFYNFHALKYNANSVMLPFWALATFAFLKAIEGRKQFWSALTGLSAGVAMLGKYWTIFLVGGLAISVALQPTRRGIFRSSAPYIAVLSGCIVLIAYAAVLPVDVFTTLGRASTRLPAPFLDAAVSAARYIIGALAYVAPAIVAVALLARASPDAWREALFPDDERRLLWRNCLILPNMLPAVAAIFLSLSMTPLWTMPGWSLLPLVLLSSPAISVDATAVRRAVMIAGSYTLLACAASPVVAYYNQRYVTPHPPDLASSLATDIGRAWSPSSRPIGAVAGEYNLAVSVSFYLNVPYADIWQTRPGEYADQQKFRADVPLVLVCPTTAAFCVDEARRLMESRHDARRLDLMEQKTLFGRPGIPVSFVVVLAP